MLHRARRRRTLTFAVGAALCVTLCSCSTGPRAGDYAELRGAHLAVVGDWSGTEQARFVAVLRSFSARTGVAVSYRWAQQSVPQTLDARLAAGDPPDIALLPQPGLLSRYAKAGWLVPLDAATVRLVRRDYSSVWQSLATSGGRLYGVWFKAANKSLLWYDVAAFETAGIAPPEDLAGLLSAATTLRAAGIAPFSVAGADRWTLTDWFENLYLQLSGPQAYTLLATHHLSWTDPSVTTALHMMGRLLAPQNLRRCVAGTLRTGFDKSVVDAFATPPGAAMVMEGDFVAGAVSADPAVQLGVDVDAVPFPAERPGVPALVGGGDMAVQLRPSEAGAELLRYLASPDAAAVWARKGGFISPNQQLDLAVYPDPLTRSIARSLVEAGDGFRFDLSDLQPPVFGSTPTAGMQLALHDFLRTRDVSGTASRLERMADAAYAGQAR